MNGLETKMTVDALKPAAGLMNAMLAPKVERVRKWAQNREIESYLKNDAKLRDLLEAYINSIFKRVSEISTLVFPQEKLPLDALYEPVNLTRSENAPGLGRNVEYEIDLAASGQCLFIIDDAGMGKSTFAKHLCIRIFEYTNQIPILFDLANFSKDKSLVENLASELDDIDKDFDRALFKKLVASGYIFIILDGFDEAPSEIQEKIRHEIKTFNDKKGMCSVVVTSRPRERLPNLTGATMLRLQSLSKQQAINIFHKYDKLAKWEVGKNLVSEIERIPERFLQTPLLVSLLYRTYSFNKSIADKITVFYSEIYDALFKGHDLTKSGYVREKLSKLDVDSFRTLLRAFSFYYVAKISEIKHTYEDMLKLIDEAKKVCALPETNSRNFLDDLLEAVPLLTRDGPTLKFMHRSIAEYFAAEYIVNRDDSLLFFNKLVNGRARFKFAETIEYVQELAPGLYNETIIMPLANKYLEIYRLGEQGLYETLNFAYRWAVSIWPLDEVKREQDLEIPPAPIGESRGQSFMYGTFQEREYVISITVSEKRTITPGSWDELTVPVNGDDANRKFHRVQSDENVEKLLSTLNVREWYESTAKQIEKLRGTVELDEIMARAILMPVKRKKNLDGRRNSTFVISPDRCKNLVESVKGINDAEKGIDEIMGFVNS